MDRIKEGKSMGGLLLIFYIFLIFYYHVMLY